MQVNVTHRRHCMDKMENVLLILIEYTMLDEITHMRIVPVVACIKQSTSKRRVVPVFLLPKQQLYQEN